MKPDTILSVQREHLPACLATLHAAFSASAERFGYTEETYPTSGAYLTLADLEEALCRHVHMYAALLNGEVVGYVQLEKLMPGVYSFQRFAVLPAYQGQGIGRALIDHCRMRAAAIGAKKLTLLMIYENETLRHFYEVNGFRLVRVERDPRYPLTCGIMEMPIGNE